MNFTVLGLFYVRLMGTVKLTGTPSLPVPVTFAIQRYRAAVNGNKEAERWIDTWKREHPGERLPSILAENYVTLDDWCNCPVWGGLLFAHGVKAQPIEKP